MFKQEELAGIELKLWNAVSSQDQVKFDAKNEPVRADLIAQLLLGIGFTPRCRKLTVQNAIVEDQIDLEAGRLVFPVKFVNCELKAPMILEQVSAPGIYFVSCAIAGLLATQLHTKDNLVLSDCANSGRTVLTGAHIGGQLAFWSTTLSARSTEDVLTADGLVVEKDLYLSDGFRADGPVRMVGARIGGEFICGRTEFNNPGGVALNVSGLVVEEHVYWDKDFRSRGEIKFDGGSVHGKLVGSNGSFANQGRMALCLKGLTVKQDVAFEAAAVDGMIDLTGCDIGGNLNLTNGVFSNPDTTALDLARARIAQNMICRNGCEVTGKVLLAGAEITGSLWCDGGRFRNPNGASIDATGLTVGRDVSMSRQPEGPRFRALGKVLLSDGDVGGSLICDGGWFVNAGGVAIKATGLSVTRDVRLGSRFTVEGEVDLTDSRVGGGLCCTGGKFLNRAVALIGDRMNIRQSAEFGVRFRAKGTVHLRDAQFGADLRFERAKLAGSDDAPALTLSGAKVGDRLIMDLAKEPTGRIELSGAVVGLLDDRKCRWPKEVLLDDFVYRTLPVVESDVPELADRLAWLRRHPGYVPQIYRQLALAYRAAGLDGEAIKVFIAGEDARLKSYRGRLGLLWRSLGLLFKITVMYGYRPLLVLPWLLGLEAVGSLWLCALYSWGDFTPRWRVEHHEQFNAWLYTLDLLVPVAGLNQRDPWIALGAANWSAATFTVLGWALALCLVAGVGRMFKTR